MFDKEYSFKGKHSRMVNELTGEFYLASEDGNRQEKHNLFKRNYDVYLLAPIIGFLYQRKSTVDNDSTINPTKIFAEIMMKNVDDLNFNYRIIMLLDKNNESDPEKRVDKAFRGLENKEDELLYNSYVLGGVEVLHEKLIQTANTPDDYINNLYDFIEEFNERYNEDLDMDNIYELARNNSF